MDNNTVATNGNNRLEMPWFLAGVGAGVALTLLFAPLSGDQTRRLITRRVKDGEDWVKDQATAAEDYVTSTAGGLRDKARDVAKVIAR